MRFPPASSLTPPACQRRAFNGNQRRQRARWGGTVETVRRCVPLALPVRTEQLITERELRFDAIEFEAK